MPGFISSLLALWAVIQAPRSAKILAPSGPPMNFSRSQAPSGFLAGLVIVKQIRLPSDFWLTLPGIGATSHSKLPASPGLGTLRRK